MPLNVADTINGLAESILNMPLVNRVAQNPIYTALLIAIIVVITIAIVFREADTNESLLIMSTRGGFWVFFMLVGIMFVHNKVLSAEMQAGAKAGRYDSVFNGGYSGVVSPGGALGTAFEDSVVPVTINTDFSTL